MARGNQPQREQTYRERALKLFPWICAHCGREFDGKKLSLLTVHHKDHNHDNNPPDGSNWELLCLYCHDNEHQRYQAADASGEAPTSREPDRPSTFTPFAHLADLLKRKNVAEEASARNHFIRAWQSGAPVTGADACKMRVRSCNQTFRNAGPAPFSPFPHLSALTTLPE